MENVKIKKFFRSMKCHGEIMLRGAIRTLYGAAILGLICAAVYGFVCVGNEKGYTAVIDFSSAVIMLITAIANMYEIGRKRKNGNG